MILTEPSARLSTHRYVSPPEPVFFPVEDDMPEAREHYLIRGPLFDSVRLAFGSRATVGTDQFVYWDAADAGKCCAPDLFVRLGVPDASFESWQTWQRGTPELAVEVVSASDTPAAAWEAKLARYRSLGVSMLVRFDRKDDTRPLRIWDRVREDLVERDPSDPELARCELLDGFWQVIPDPETRRALRLSRDAEGTDLYPTPLELEAEGRRAEAEARARAEAGRAQAEAGRAEAEAHARELEAELAKLRGA
jgi:Uma2 family endonuclease